MKYLNLPPLRRLPRVTETDQNKSSRNSPATDSTQIIGTRSFRPTKSRYYHVFGLCVDPDFRRQGLGEHLCREAERMMYHQGARGYVGEANNEETAQYYVRTLGVRICRLRFAGWRRGLIPYKKVFRQEGFSDSTARRARSCVLYLMRRRYIGKLIEFAARRIEPA